MSAELIRSKIASAVSKATEAQDAARQWIGKRGGENTPTFLLLECDRAISDLRAAIAAADAAMAQPERDETPQASDAGSIKRAAGRPALERATFLPLYDGDSVSPAAQPVPAQAVAPDGWVLVPKELLQDAAASIDDYRAGIEFGSPDRKLLGRLKAAIAAAAPAAPTTDKEQHA